MHNRAIFLAFFVFAANAAQAGEDAFTTGPAIEKFGPVAEVETDFSIPDGAVLKHAFDVSKQAEQGELNRTLASAARFINMHARAGMPTENLKLAVVIHGGAVKDVANTAYYKKAVGGVNANAALIETLIEYGVQIIVCGQSATYYDVKNTDLSPGVQMALSAMTAHAVLQQEGYTLNPF